MQCIQNTLLMFKTRCEYSKHVSNVSNALLIFKHVLNVSNVLQIFKIRCNISTALYSQRVANSRNK